MLRNQTTKVTVKYGNTVLKRGTDYKITGVTRAKNAGKYKVTVKGINNYKGTKTIYYTINKAAQKSVKVKVKLLRRRSLYLVLRQRQRLLTSQPIRRSRLRMARLLLVRVSRRAQR